MGLCLSFLPNFPGAMSIQGGTFIPDSRVAPPGFFLGKRGKPFLKKIWYNVNFTKESHKNGILFMYK